MNVNDVLLREDIERVKRRFEARLIDAGDCRVWWGPVNHNKYGLIGVGRGRVSTHRLAWAFSFGAIPDGSMVLHRCDNPPCCNPKHLFLGTHQDNVDDMVRKNRHRVANPSLSVLNADMVRAIRVDTRSDIELSAEYGVTRSAIWKARNRFWWKHVV
jgi:hypothetical protein